MQRLIPTSVLTKTALCALLSLTAVGVTTRAQAQGASVETATAAQKKTAQKAFEQGMKALKAKKHDEALAAFKSSYEAVASPNSHLMVARELVELGRLEEAWEAYGKTAAEADAAAQKDQKYQNAADEARKEQNDLKKKLGFIDLDTTGTQAGDRITVRGREIPQGSWSQPVPAAPGSATVTLVHNDGTETSKDVTITAGQDTKVDFTPPKAAPPTAEPAKTSGEASAKLDTSGHTNLRTWAYVAGGVGVAGVATFAIFGLMANSKHSKLQDNCPNNKCPADLQSDADAGKRDQTIANIGLVVGVVGLGTGTVLYLMSGKKNQENAAMHTPPRRGPHVDGVSVGYRSILVNGSF
jgi:hypothetical protein